MATEGDLAAWEQQLLDEMSGLKACQQRVTADSSLPPATKARFKDILKSLDSSVAQVLARTQALRSQDLDGQEFEEKAEALQRDYRHILRNITRILTTINPVAETLRTESSPDSPFDLTQLTAEFAALQRMTDASRRNLQSHSHATMEAQLREVRAENDALTVKLQSLEEEQEELARLADSLQLRVARLEKRRDPLPLDTAPKLIAKRVGEAEKLLKR